MNRYKVEIITHNHRFHKNIEARDMRIKDGRAEFLVEPPEPGHYQVTQSYPADCTFVNNIEYNIPHTKKVSV